MDGSGNIITSKVGLLNLYRKTYIERLAPKDAKENYLALQKSKEALFETRYEIASSRKSDIWSTEQVVKVCKSLKNRKARDELGLVYELFKPPYAGNDVYLSLSKNV